MRRLAGVLAAVVIALAGSACTDDEVGAGEASVLVDEGSRVLVAERGEDLRRAEGRITLHAGSQVKVLEGSASISLHRGARLEVRTGSEVQLGDPVVLVSDDLLVTSAARPVEVVAAGSQFSVSGVARVSRDFAVSAASYRGEVRLRSAARSLTIPALRQAAAASLGVLPAEPEALDYDPADPWDRRFLGSAIDLGSELEAKSEGFSRSLGPNEGRTAGFYRLLLPELEDEPAFGPELVGDDRPPGELLVGATIAVSGNRGTFAERWASVFAFRDQKARWGLVALDQQVNDLQGLVSAVDQAIGRQSFAFAPLPAGAARPVAAIGPAPVETPPAIQAPRPAVPPAPPRPPATTPTTAPPLLDLPQLVPDPEPLPPTVDLLTPLVDTLAATIDGLLSGQ